MLRFAKAVLAIIGSTVDGALVFLVIGIIFFHDGSLGDGIAGAALLLFGVILGLCVGIVLAARLFRTKSKPAEAPN